TNTGRSRAATSRPSTISPMLRRASRISRPSSASDTAGTAGRALRRRIDSTLRDSMRIDFGLAPRRAALVARAALSLFLAAASPALATDARLLQGLPITFVEPYGPHSVTNIPLALMRDEIGRKTGAAVEIRSIGGKAGGTALDYVINSPPGGLVFAVLDPLSRQLAEVGGERADLLGAVQP